MAHLIGLDTPEWMDRAACADAPDPAAFMSDSVSSPLVCARCPVVRECGDHAEKLGERFGVWGGIDRRAVN